jgi:aminoglycoside 6'-N-acetyltransferase
VKLREHSIVLRGDLVVMRPMTEEDWDVLLKWNSDPEVLCFCEGDDIASWDLEPMKKLYRGTSQNAFCFIIEFEGQSIGECWLQRMNLERILAKYPNKDCRRIDLMIGEKHLWGQGLGTDVICTLTKFGFEEQNADMIFGCSIGDYNPRSLRAFQKAGYEIDAKIEVEPGKKARCEYDVTIAREEWQYGASDEVEQRSHNGVRQTGH